MLNWVGARTQSCFTPLTMGKNPERSLLNLTWPRLSLWCWITMPRNFGGSQSASWSSTVPFCSLCQTLWSGLKTLHTVLCFALCISLGAVWGQTPCMWCSCWLWIHTGFLVDGLQKRWVPICLGIHEQGFFLQWRAEWSPDSWRNLIFLPCFCTRWWWLHRKDHLGSFPAPNNWQGVRRFYCVKLVLPLSRALVESRRLPLPCHSSNALCLW